MFLGKSACGKGGDVMETFSVSIHSGIVRLAKAS
jgi:hypothetical protein